MRVIDLSHRITHDMPVYPGDPSPSFEVFSTYERDGFRQTMIHMSSHTGTHVDAPSHLYSQGRSLGCMQLSHFVGSAFVIDCSDLKAGDKIKMEYVARFWPVAEHADFLLFKTGWDRYWGRPQYYKNYPVLSSEAAYYVSGKHKNQFKGIGVDAPSVDLPTDANLTLHKILLAKGLVVFENLTSLDEVAHAGLFTFCAMPLSCYEMDGSPVRAAAFLLN